LDSHILCECGDIFGVFGEGDAQKRRTKKNAAKSSHNGVGKFPWRYGPAGAEPVTPGIDVLVIKGDKIAAVYVFPDSPKK